jgi:hypothetical protein
MSFDDVARRMQQRHSEGMVPRLDAPPPGPELDADAFNRSILEAERRAAKQRDVTYGAILLGLGLLITLGTYGSASQGGGTYIVAYGPMIYGAIRLFRGLAT